MNTIKTKNLDFTFEIGVETEIFNDIKHVKPSFMGNQKSKKKRRLLFTNPK